MMDVDTKDDRNAAGWKGHNMFEALLRNTVSDHIPRQLTGEWRTTQLPGNVMCVQSTYSLPQVMRRLSSENFLSCPVLDGRKYVGMISMADLVIHTCKMFWGETKEEWIDFWNRSEKFQSTLVSEIMEVPGVENRDPHPPIHPDASSLFALELFARTGIQRAAVVDQAKGKVTNILTQSMLISFCRQNQVFMQGLLQRKVRDMEATTLLNRGDPSYEGPPSTFDMVHTVRENDRAINAFNKMVTEKVSGVAIVDEDGALTGSISLRDLRGVGMDGDKFQLLFDTVKTFKKKVREMYPMQAPFTHYSSRMIPHGGYFVEPTAPLQTVLEIMNDGNIHRVYVCSSSSVAAGTPRPIGVISQRDVLMEVMMYIQGYMRLPPSQAPAIIVD